MQMAGGGLGSRVRNGRLGGMAAARSYRGYWVHWLAHAAGSGHQGAWVGQSGLPAWQHGQRRLRKV